MKFRITFIDIAYIAKYHEGKLKNFPYNRAKSCIMYADSAEQAKAAFREMNPNKAFQHILEMEG